MAGIGHECEGAGKVASDCLDRNEEECEDERGEERLASTVVRGVHGTMVAGERMAAGRGATVEMAAAAAERAAPWLVSSSA